MVELQIIQRMPAVIPTEIKDSAVQGWLAGLSRRPNAMKHQVSEGSVDNFVKGWKLQHGPDGEYERLRALGIAISKSGLSIQQCADGHRVAMNMKNLGVAEDDYEVFISKLWKRYVASGLSPDILVEQINQLYYFLETNENHMLRTTSIPQILEFMKAKLEDVKNLESKEQNLKKSNMELQFQKETLEAELEWDSQLKEKLNKNGFKKEEVSIFVDAALSMRERGYDIFDIVQRFSSFEKLEEVCADVQLKRANAALEYDQLKAGITDLKVRLSENSQKLRDLDTLRYLGFGLSEFRMLRDIITEVGEERDIIGNEAVKVFFEDLQNHYYDYVRLRKSVTELKAEKTELSAKDATNYVSKIESFTKGSKESDHKNIEDNRSRKEDMPNDNNYAAASQRGETGPQSNSNTGTPCFHEQIEGDYLYDLSYEEQVLAKSESNNQGEKEDSVWDLQSYSRKYVPNFVNDPSSSSHIDNTGVIDPNPTASEDRRFFFPPNPNKGSSQRTRPKPPSMPKLRKLRRSKSVYIPNTINRLDMEGQIPVAERKRPGPEQGEQWPPNMDEIYSKWVDTILETILESMGYSLPKELTQGRQGPPNQLARPYKSSEPIVDSSPYFSDPGPIG